ETALKQGQTLPVRFILPENLKTLLKPNGQAIVLKIAPEHLGPAKLSISMHKDKLRAHLTVHSSEAKATLESSLHHLVDQLAKADIKVDFIDVTVSDRNAGNEFLSRQSQGQKSNSMHRFNYDDENIDESSPIVQRLQRKADNYITSNGVNLLV
ncbi:MAG: flagellar hook-length control protein FliK, partial [FCB group bacterium]|nr:flagellar hook-length control protein FliK [FCB group bacterium]